MIDPLKNTRNYLIGEKFKIGDLVMHKDADRFTTPFMSCVQAPGKVVDFVRDSSLVEYDYDGHPTYFLFLNSALILQKREFEMKQPQDNICLDHLKKRVSDLEKEVARKNELIQNLMSRVKSAYDVHTGKSLKVVEY